MKWCKLLDNCTFKIAKSQQQKNQNQPNSALPTFYYLYITKKKSDEKLQKVTNSASEMQQMQNALVFSVLSQTHCLLHTHTALDGRNYGKILT